MPLISFSSIKVKLVLLINETDFITGRFLKMSFIYYCTDIGLMSGYIYNNNNIIHKIIIK